MTRPPRASGSIEIETPAKLNLGLRLVGRRADGYHLLESLFAPIEIHDRLEIEILPGSHQIELEVSIASESGLPAVLSEVTSGPDNLVARAAEAFCKAHGLDYRIRIRLEKAIPAAAGMGGGSSDAAAVLNGLAALTGVGRGPEVLGELALPLGADVPFFLDPRPSLVTGMGETLTPISGFPSSHLVVANPGISLDTAEVYRASDVLEGALTERRPGSTMRAISRLCHENGHPLDGASADSPERGLESGADSGTRDHWNELLINDLVPAARRLCPPVGRLLASIGELGALGVGMTGSGATVFGVFETRHEADEAANRLRGSMEMSAGEAWLQVSRVMGRY